MGWEIGAVIGVVLGLGVGYRLFKAFVRQVIRWVDSAQ